MLAKQIKLALLGVLIGSTSFGISSANGQQLERPSQRYQPTQVDPTAGEVIHTASQIPAVRVRMSDQAEQGPEDKYLIRQVAYQEPVKAPPVPAILAGTSDFQPATRKATSLRNAFQKQFGQSKRAATSAIEQAAPLMDQAIQARTPRIAPEEISTQRALLEKQLRDIKSRTAAREAELADRARTAAREAELADRARMVAEKATRSAKTIRQAAEPADNFSASQFLRQINGKETTEFRATRSGSPLKASRADYSDTQSRKASFKTNMRQGVRQVSLEDDIQSERSESAAIRLKAPSIEVETFGPRSIGVNKPATYEVVVKNNSGSDAERILVGINLPEWVEVSNVNLTTGGKELTDGKDKARLVWTIDRIGAGKTQTATILAVPRKAEMFDVGVEWTLVPRTGKANIRVTEPRLTMNISGPAEVEFGEVARYLVTVRNSGTGTAENVTCQKRSVANDRF